MKNALILCIFAARTLAHSHIDSQKASLLTDKNYGEKSLFTPFKYEHSSPEHEIDFALYFEGDLGFESDTEKAVGPYLMMDSKDVLLYYNLRYGAMSTKLPKDPSMPLIIFVQFCFLIILAV